MRRKRDQRLSRVAWFALLIGIPVFSNQVNSHDWYPLECCHALDCAPVESVEILTPASADGLPAMVVTTKSGTVIVPVSSSQPVACSCCVFSSPLLRDQRLVLQPTGTKAISSAL